MKTTPKLLAGVLLFVFMIAPTAYAQNPRQSTNRQTAQAQNQEAQDKRAQRTEERKARLQLKLDEAKLKRLEARCKNSQGKISSLSQRVQGIQTSRAQKYTNLQSRLERLTAQLEAKGLQTDQLKTHTDTLAELIEQYEADLASYQTVLDDLAAMDCQADPEGFQAALTDARSSLGTVREAILAIKAHLLDEVKPELQAIRQSFDTGTEKPAETPAQQPDAAADDSEQTDPDTPVSNEATE